MDILYQCSLLSLNSVKCCKVIQKDDYKDHKRWHYIANIGMIKCYGCSSSFWIKRGVGLEYAFKVRAGWCVWEATDPDMSWERSLWGAVFLLCVCAHLAYKIVREEYCLLRNIFILKDCVNNTLGHWLLFFFLCLIFCLICILATVPKCTFFMCIFMLGFQRKQKWKD